MVRVKECFEQIIQDNSWLSKFLIGTLICFIPIVNILALGYFFRYVYNIQNTKSLDLPKWEEWQILLKESLAGLFIVILYGLIPVTIGLLLSEILNIFTFTWLSYLPLSLVLFIVPSLLAHSFFLLSKGFSIQELFLNTKNLLEAAFKSLPYFFTPNLALIGLLALGLPLYGFAFFMGFAVYFAYSTLILVDYYKK